MDEQNISTNKFGLWKKWFWISLLILFIVALVALGFVARKSTIQPSNTLNQTQTTQTQIVRVIDPKSIMGKIIGITSATIVVQTTEDGSTQAISRQVTTNTATVFERMIPKDEKIYQGEWSALTTKMKTAQTSSTPSPGEYPDPFTFQKISLADLRPGDSINITSTEDILTANQFMATKIVVVSILFN